MKVSKIFHAFRVKGEGIDNLRVSTIPFVMMLSKRAKKEPSRWKFVYQNRWTKIGVMQTRNKGPKNFLPGNIPLLSSVLFAHIPSALGPSSTGF